MESIDTEALHNREWAMSNLLEPGEAIMQTATLQDIINHVAGTIDELKYYGYSPTPEELKIYFSDLLIQLETLKKDGHYGRHF